MLMNYIVSREETARCKLVVDVNMAMVEVVAKHQRLFNGVACSYIIPFSNFQHFFLMLRVF